MKKIMRLVSVQIWALLGDMLSLGDTKRKRPKVLYLGIILFVTVMGGVAFFYCYMIGKGLLLYDGIELLPPLIMAVTSIIILMTTVFKIKGTIFGFRDYDMIMSLPVSTAGVVASRVILLYCVNFLFVLMIMVPMMTAYGILVKPDIFFYLTGTIAMFFVPLVPIILASVLGTLVTFAASRFRHSNLVVILISIIALFSIMSLSFASGKSGEEMVNLSKALTEQVNSIYPLAQLYTRAVCDYDMAALASFLLYSLGSFGIFSYIIGKLFKKVNSAIMTGRSRSNYKLGGLKASTPFKALFIKELKRYFSSPLYVLNTGFGIVLLTVGALALIFVDLEKLLGDSQAVGLLLTGGPIAVSFCVVTACTTMASISLEGKNLWIIKSLPVPAKTVFLSKIAVNLLVTAPAVMDALLITLVLDLGFIRGIFMVLVTVVCSVFIALLGLLLNLKLPNFTWTTEVIVIKQSAAALVSLFTGFIFVGLQALLLGVLGDFVPAYLIYLCLMAVVDGILYRTLMSYGVKRFHTL